MLVIEFRYDIIHLLWFLTPPRTSREIDSIVQNTGSRIQRQTIQKRSLEDSFHDPALNMDYTRMVHSDQKFEYARPVQVGDELVVTTVVEDIRSLGNNDIATFRTEVDSHGERVVTAWSKLVVRGDDA